MKKLFYGFLAVLILVISVSLIISPMGFYFANLVHMGVTKSVSFYSVLAVTTIAVSYFLINTAVLRLFFDWLTKSDKPD